MTEEVCAGCGRVATGEAYCPVCNRPLRAVAERPAPPGWVVPGEPGENGDGTLAGAPSEVPPETGDETGEPADAEGGGVAGRQPAGADDLPGGPGWRVRVNAAAAAMQAEAEARAEAAAAEERRPGPSWVYPALLTVIILSAAAAAVLLIVHALRR